MSVWIPKSFDEACKRNAGRRKLHMRRRKERADRIVRLIAAIDAVPELLESVYGWVALTAETIKMSKATASRDFTLARRIHVQFTRMFGRTLEPHRDQIKWSWDWSHYGFQTPESWRAGHRKPVGHFPFSTRAIVCEEAYCGYTPQSWQPQEWSFQYKSSGNLLSMLNSLSR